LTVHLNGGIYIRQAVAALKDLWENALKRYACRLA